MQVKESDKWWDVESNGLRWRPGQPLSSLPCEHKNWKDAGKSGLHQVKRGRRELSEQFIDKHLLGLYVNNAGHTHRASQSRSAGSSFAYLEKRPSGRLPPKAGLNHTLPCPSCHRPGIVLNVKEETHALGKMRQDGVQKYEAGRNVAYVSWGERWGKEAWEVKSQETEKNERRRKGVDVYSEQMEIHLLSCIKFFLMF